MHGSGIRTGTTTSRPDALTENPPTARLLEMTRVLALQGRRPSGVDRVCLAYLRAIVADELPCFGLVRTWLGYILLDRKGMQAVLACLEGEAPWPAPDLLSRLRHGAGDRRQVTDTLVRRHAIARARPRFLKYILRRHLPAGVAYINVDQTQLTDRVLAAVKSVPEARVTVFLHDTIPLDHPHYQTPEAVDKLAAILRRCSAQADQILTNSEASAAGIRKHMAKLGPVPPITVAHLGLEADFFDFVDNAQGLEIAAPYFVCIGTIEPRKNIPFLLSLWEQMARSADPEKMPRLVICGRRGWESQRVLDRLDNTPLRGKFVLEFNELSDSALAATLAGSQGLLFPSRAEGFGLPPLEAAALGIPVVSDNLPVMQEVLADYPIYASVSDVYSWETIVWSLVAADPAAGSTDPDLRKPVCPPTWEAHFNAVLRVT